MNLIEMSNKDYDKMMCDKFPDLFKDRNKPASETCMCWGFNIGQGWHKLLYDLCEDLDHIYNISGFFAAFDQIKTKFGSGRFYHHFDMSDKTRTRCNKDINIWKELIDLKIEKAQHESETICSICGCKYYDKVTINHWVYDCCKECLIKNEHGRLIDSEHAKELVEEFEEMQAKREEIQYQIEKMDRKTLGETLELIYMKNNLIDAIYDLKTF